MVKSSASGGLPRPPRICSPRAKFLATPLHIIQESIAQYLPQPLWSGLPVKMAEHRRDPILSDWMSIKNEGCNSFSFWPTSFSQKSAACASHVLYVLAELLVGGNQRCLIDED